MADLEIKVAAIEALTPRIKKFEFVPVNGGDLPAFEAGAHIDVHTGNGLLKSYSLANDPTERHRYVTAILREENGAGGSKWMHDDLKAGDTLRVRAPTNHFPLDMGATEHLLIAGGIGITPMLAMGHALAAAGAKCHLHYCTKSPADTAFAEQVKEVFGDNLTFHHDGGDPAKGIKLDEVLAAPAEGAHVYICGPAGLLNAARAAASHWPSGNVHFELFSSAKTEEAAAATGASPGKSRNQAFEVEIASSGKVIEIPADKTILETLRDNDIEVVFVCEEGWCATCEVGLLGGQADHRDEVLDDADKEANTKIQVCVSRAMPGEKLILDL